MLAPTDIAAADAAEGDPRTELIAARLRQGILSAKPPIDARMPSFAFEHLMDGDAGHLHRAHNLLDLPIESQRPLVGPLLVRLKRSLLRMLHPLPEVQTGWNAANARTVGLLIHQMAAQARNIELLEQQIADLQEKLDR
ncbi:MAG: hypothetical protein ACHQHO_02370 [Solirubrobacterales bacterium]